ncbi:hypothetical protein ABZT26_03045 [Streptomyces sp. NPDC005395]|uniref:hypothetical protein n=1 Tax=unclassified Streptomyces TaxID=2593676 RepID=UPI001F29CA8D|nr:hypothetical protein [Streptomyces sp. BSE6.1]
MTENGKTMHDTPDQLRGFLRLCLGPGRGIERTPAKLVEVLPGPLHDDLIRHAPHLRALRHRADTLAAQQQVAHQAYAQAVADWIHDEQPAPPRPPMPLLDAVTVAYEAAVAHIDGCDVCRPDMRLPEMCQAGQEAAVGALGHFAPDDTCAHLAWEVTGQHRDAQDQLVQERRCADCPQRLEPLVVTGPDTAAAGQP